MRAIHQFLPTLDPGDAVGNHTLEAQRLLRGLGLESEIYTQTVHHSMVGRAHSFQKFTGGPGVAVVYHLAVGSVLADLLLSRTEPLVVDYHNITPAKFFDEWDPPILHAVEWGRNQMAALAPTLPPRPRRLRVQPGRDRRERLQADGGRADPPRPARGSTARSTSVCWPSSSRGSRREAPTGCSWAGSLRTSASTTSSRRSRPTARSTTRTHGCASSEALPPSRTPPRCAPSCASSGSATASP